jgi:hypothetical protein
VLSLRLTLAETPDLLQPEVQSLPASLPAHLGCCWSAGEKLLRVQVVERLSAPASGAARVPALGCTGVAHWPEHCSERPAIGAGGWEEGNTAAALTQE